nr:non-ribosomal peptide synthetase [Streptomyces sp. SID13031]
MMGISDAVGRVRFSTGAALNGAMAQTRKQRELAHIQRADLARLQERAKSWTTDCSAPTLVRRAGRIGTEIIRHLHFAGRRRGSERIEAFAANCNSWKLREASSTSCLRSVRGVLIRMSLTTPATVEAMFRHRAAKDPDAIACRDRHGDWTYGVLDAWVTQVASALRAAGCRTGDLIPVSTDRDAGLLAALLGVMRAGGTYVPIDAKAPESRNRLVLEQLGAKLLITGSSDSFRTEDHQTIVVEHCRSEDPMSEQGQLWEPAAAAYVIFTSGSTGSPKGVQVGQSALLQMMVSAQDIVRLAPGETWLALTTPSFDIAALELFLPLCHGGIVELASAEVAEDPAAVAARLDQGGLAVAQATPTMWRAVVESGWRCTAELKVLCGGEELAPDLAEQLRNRSGRVWNVYGPTETTIWSTFCELTSSVEHAVTIGRPFAGEVVYVVDDDGNRLPPGSIGELWIGGAGVADGYLNQPQLTAAKFTSDPFAGSGRVYRTGDLAAFDADGALRFHGRRDSQIKLRGHRIELGEIEAVLRADTEVADVVVLVQGDTPGHERLAAFTRPAHRSQLDVSALFARCAQLLPAVMVPTACLVLQDFPLTPSGKIDRVALRSTSAPLIARPDDGDRPQDGKEAAIAAVFGLVLDRRDIRANANFFDLGGHSLMANQVVTRLRASGLQVTLRDIFEAPTVAGLAARVSEGPGTDDAVARVDVPAEWPLSFAQERLWFQDRLGTSGPEHHIQAAYTLIGPVSPALVRSALQRVVDRHEPLRTVFAESDGRPVQRVLDAVRVELPVTDVDGETAAARLNIARELMHGSFVEPFTLRSAPLFRFELFQLGESEHLLYLCMHHICTDGWSMGIIAAEVMEIYAAEHRGERDSLPAVASYRAAALAERQQTNSQVFERQLADVTGRLAAYPTSTSIILDRARPDQQVVAGGTVRSTLGVEVTAAVGRLARECGATVHSVLLAAYAALLHRHGASDEMVIASPSANRSRPELEGMVGVFVNTLPIAVRFDSRLPFADLVRDVRDATLEAMTAVGVPIDRIVDALKIPRSLAALPLTQVAFVLHNAPMPTVALPGIEVEPLSLDTGMSMYDLRLVATERSGQIELQLDHATSVIDPATVGALLERLTKALDSLVDRTTATTEPLPIPTDTVVALTSGEAVRSATTVPALFREVVRNTPSAPAVSAGDKTWSFAELDRGSDAVAAALRTAGVGPGDLVGLMLGRGLDLAAAVLGVVKLGGAYVCIDGALPDSRIDFIIADAGCKVIVTNEHDLDHASRTGIDVVDLDEIDRTATLEPSVQGPGPDDVAYVTYTSGSTGTPKGTLVPHRSIAGFWRDVDYADFGPGTTFLAHSSTSWDALTLEFWSMVLSGGRCHFVPAGISGPEDLARHQAHGGADTVWLTAAFFNAIVDADPAALAGFQQVLIGGEAASLRHVRAFRRLYPQSRLINGYGPSECTVFTTCQVIPPDVPRDWTSVPIGRPIGDRKVWVMDDDGRPVAPLIPGELCVGGDAVALGYLNQPDLNRERFIDWSGETLYRSGDRVRQRSDGLLEFLGRSDDQVKLRGYRIELGEIERALAVHPAVGTAAVVLRTDDQGISRLAAYITPAPAEQLLNLAGELRRHLRISLPEYMVPASIQALAELPRQSTGKIDRNGLPDPVWQAGSPVDQPDPVEEDGRLGTLTAIWAAVLGLETVGPDENFFDIGGDSITSIQVVVRAREAGIGIGPKDLFDHQTVRSVLSVAAAESESGTTSQDVLAGDIPLAPIQQWMFELGLGDVNRFPQSLMLDFAADPGETVLQRAVDALVSHHDMLRARFTQRAGRWSQAYGPAATASTVSRVSIDTAHPTADEIEAIVSATHGTIDVSAGPVFRAVWIGLADGTGKLFLVGHHLCMDGYSWNVLLDDLLRGLRTPADEAIPLPAKTTSYGDWVESLQQWSGSVPAKRQLAYWQEQAGRGIPWLEPAGTPVRQIHSSVLSESLAESVLREVPGGYGVEPVEVMIAALVAAVLGDSAQRELVVELEHHGRDAIAEGHVLDRTIGWFTSLYPILLRASPETEQLLQVTKDAVRRLPGSGQGHGALRYLAGEDLKGGADVRFNYLGRFDALQSSVEGISLSTHALGDHASLPADGGLALNITAFTLANRVHVRWDYRADRITPEQVALVADSWAAWIEKICTFCLTTSGHSLVPADFPLADLDQSVLDELMEGL